MPWHMGVCPHKRFKFVGFNKIVDLSGAVFPSLPLSLSRSLWIFMALTDIHARAHARIIFYYFDFIRNAYPSLNAATLSLSLL